MSAHAISRVNFAPEQTLTWLPRKYFPQCIYNAARSKSHLPTSRNHHWYRPFKVSSWLMLLIYEHYWAPPSQRMQNECHVCSHVKCIPNGQSSEKWQISPHAGNCGKCTSPNALPDMNTTKWFACHEKCHRKGHMDFTTLYTLHRRWIIWSSASHTNFYWQCASTSRTPMKSCEKKKHTLALPENMLATAFNRRPFQIYPRRRCFIS